MCCFLYAPLLFSTVAGSVYPSFSVWFSFIFLCMLQFIFALSLCFAAALPTVFTFISIERQRAELNLIVCTNFHLWNKLRRQTHVFRHERNIYTQKKKATRKNDNNDKWHNCVDAERFLTVILNLNIWENFSCSIPKCTLNFGLTVRCSVWWFQNY